MRSALPRSAFQTLKTPASQTPLRVQRAALTNWEDSDVQMTAAVTELADCQALAERLADGKAAVEGDLSRLRAGLRAAGLDPDHYSLPQDVLSSISPDRHAATFVPTTSPPSIPANGAGGGGLPTPSRLRADDEPSPAAAGHLTQNSDPDGGAALCTGLHTAPLPRPHNFLPSQEPIAEVGSGVLQSRVQSPSSAAARAQASSKDVLSQRKGTALTAATIQGLAVLSVPDKGSLDVVEEAVVKAAQSECAFTLSASASVMLGERMLSVRANVCVMACTKTLSDVR
jgi:hypothetical protein